MTALEVASEDSLVPALGLASDMRLDVAWVTVLSVETLVLGLDSASDMVWEMALEDLLVLELGLASDLRSNAVLETTSVVELEDSLVLELGLR